MPPLNEGERLPPQMLVEDDDEELEELLPKPPHDRREEVEEVPRDVVDELEPNVFLLANPSPDTFCL